MLLLARKMDKLDIAIHELRLSVVISGTFSQLLPTIKEGEDGLFSRFNYLYLTGNYEFKNVFDRENSENVRRIFAETSQKMVLLFELLQNRTITFEFTKEQEKAFLLFFTEQKNEMMNHLSDRGEVSRQIFSGAMNRIGLMCFRAAMILTVLRSFEEGQLEKREENTPEIVLICKEVDFKTAQEFAEMARNNALAVFNRLPLPNILQYEKNKVSKKEVKEKYIEEAIALQKIGKSYGEIAKILLGDESKKATIYGWLN
jgi:hypothetical protein